jgi:hypothetical protein
VIPRGVAAPRSAREVAIGMNTRGDKIFVIGITIALVGVFLFVAFQAFDFWNSIPGALNPNAVVPMTLGIVGSLVLAAIVIGIYFRGRRDEIREAEAEERRRKGSRP